MRHSRRAVMAERYKLYAKKNILNSRYLVRNVQISLLVLVVVAMVVGTTMLVSMDDSRGEVALVDTKVSVKDALFDNTETIKRTTEELTTEELTTEEVTTEEQTTTAVTESVIVEKVRTELDNTITEVVSGVTPVEEEKQEEAKGEFANKCIAKVDDTLNIRKDPSAEAEFVGQMNNGAIAIVQGSEGEWTKIKSGDVEGYVLTEYVLTGANAEEFAKDYVTLRGTVLEDGVNIRAEKSTDAEILTVMDKDDTVTVLENPNKEEVAEEGALTETTADVELSTEEITTVPATTEAVTTEAVTTEAAKQEVVTEEEINWIPVMLEDGQTGYVSADFIEIDELYEIAVSAEELQRRAEEEAARKLAEEEAARQAAAAAAAQSAPQSTPQSSTQSSNTTNNNTSYEGATTDPITATESGEYVGTFTITAYCGCNKCSAGHNRTASGTIPTEGRTIAADTSIWPLRLAKMCLWPAKLCPAVPL